jgi:hypothetical protein
VKTFEQLYPPLAPGELLEAARIRASAMHG